jgi:prepilin-type N-terminal cleavage/methylation domain-containing protein
MKKFLSKTAFTLIELIVSLTLLSVVLLGIFSISMVLNNNGQDYGQRYLVQSDTQTTLNNILNNVSLAVGSATSVGNPPEVDLGIEIVTPAVPGDPTYIHIHQSPVPTDTTQDIWYSYKFDPVAQQISYCTVPYNLLDSLGHRGLAAAATCTREFVGSAYNIDSPAPPTYSSGVFSITIQNCLNNGAPTCNAGTTAGTSSDPVNNPEVQLTGSVQTPLEGV